MLSINTNLAGLIAQNSMKTSTDKLNQAIERMTTGLKINHASDNAANYSISTNMTTQLSAYDTAADNVAMGMDLVSYASDIISQMQDKAARLNALSTQARNGTYGAQSLSALNSEASAIMAEITRLYNTAEYNDISLFNQKEYTIASHLPQPTEVNPGARAGGDPMPIAKEEYNGFIADPWAGKDQAHIESLNTVSSVSEATGFTESEYKVSTVEDLVKLAELTNAGVDTTGKTFYLTADLDFGAYCDSKMATGGWEPIGKGSSHGFKGVFDGNGHVIKNLKIDRETAAYQGLFGHAVNGEIKNIGIVDAEVTGKDNVGGLVGYSNSSSISNSYATGDVVGPNYVGGLVGSSSHSSSISNSYATGDVVGPNHVGGLIGDNSGSVNNCYATGNVYADASSRRPVGGLIGNNSGSVNNCYATGSVSGQNVVGGLMGQNYGSINNCYATGSVSGQNSVGGLVGCSSSMSSSSISNSYATGDVTGQSFVGGLVGVVYADSGTISITVADSISYSKVNGSDTASTGTLLGGAKMTSNGTSFGTLDITNCQARPINGMNTIGGAFHNNGSAITFDLSSAQAGIGEVAIRDISTNLQVGINGDDSCRINFNTNFEFDISGIGDIQSVETFDAIVAFENLLSEKATQLGAVQNRLDSALESIEVNINNLTSSRSTIRDADIAEVSSHYIQQQILQQASATLMATANQSPAIALQLI